MEATTLATLLREHVQGVAAIPDDVLKEHWDNKVMCNDAVLDVELTSALQLKDESYGVRDNPTMAWILDRHLQGMKMAPELANENQEMLRADCGKLERETFDLLLNALWRDGNVMGWWLEQ